VDIFSAVILKTETQYVSKVSLIVLVWLKKNQALTRGYKRLLKIHTQSSDGMAVC